MIALVDCNNFFVSCERLFRPDLLNKPVAVLSSNDGCVVARSNEVKALGVPMGVPYFQVRDIFIRNKVTLFSSNFALYSNISQRILAELANFSPRLEVYSIDEAFMDLDTLSIGDYTSWAKELSNSIHRNVGVPVSVGIAPTKTLAKLASDWSKKHSGVCLLDPKNAQECYDAVLQGSDIQAVWGIGRQLAKRMLAAGVRTPWHLVHTSRSWHEATIGVNGERIYDELRGVAHYELEDERKPQKSMMVSRSFGRSVGTQHELENAVASFTAQAAARLRRFEQETELFGVYVRGVDREGFIYNQSASVRMLPSTNDTSELTEAALRLLDRVYEDEVRYKKAGVFAYQLSGDHLRQSSLIDSKSSEDRESQKQLMRAIDAINKRFGGNTVQLATIDTRVQSWHGKHQLKSPAYTTSWRQLPRISA